MRDFFRRHFSSSPPPAEFEEVERAERIFYLNYLRKGMVVIDAGANVGELTLLFARLAGADGVHAFEASTQTFARLEAVCAAAGRAVTLNHLALSDRPGPIKLHVYEQALSEFNSTAVRPLRDYGLDYDPAGVEMVNATTVDEYCRDKNIEKIDLLKIDVEGAELQVMKGARRMIEDKKVACMTFEFGQTTFDMGNEPSEIEEFLAERGYEIKNVVEKDPVFPGRGRVETAKYSMHIAMPA